MKGKRRKKWKKKKIIQKKKKQGADGLTSLINKIEDPFPVQKKIHWMKGKETTAKIINKANKEI